MLATSIITSVLCFSLRSALLVSSASAPSINGDPSLLELYVGLNLSPAGHPSSAITAYGQGSFLPILSSPRFNSSNSSESLGFSVGFFFSSLNSSNDSQDIYLAVCGGLSGNYSNSSGMYTSLSGIDDQLYGGLDLPTVADGYAVPVWIANLDSPLRSVNSSLVVVAVSDMDGTTSSNELQLRDHEGKVFWRVSNVGMMEMQDTGNLVIYDTMSRTNVVWQSSTQPRDTLLQGQKLTVGKELRSNDSSYSARMEKGGLVLYYLSAQFPDEQPSTPYWVIPVLFSNATNVLDLNTLVSVSPCRPHDAAYVSIVGSFSMNFFLDPGPCSNSSYSIMASDANDGWSYIKLENDGRLYTYAVTSSTNPPSTQRRALDHDGEVHFVAQKDPNNMRMVFSSKSSQANPYTRGCTSITLCKRDTNDDQQPTIIPYTMPYVSWGECDVPMPCGPFGVCTPRAQSLCTCPQPSPEGVTSFVATDTTNIFKGCKRLTPLPHCISGNEHINTTDFLQLNHTASIFLFGGWAFTPKSAPVEDCKRLCSFNCSCSGFIYQASSSACFFYATDEISLLNVVNTTLTSIDSSAPYGPGVPVEIFARDYATYLKIPATANNPIGEPGSKHTVIAVAVLSSFLAFLVVGVAVYLFNARRSKQSQMSKEAISRAKQEEELQDVLPLLPSRFSYQDLHEATESFSKLLGAGGCGSVYAGVLSDGREIAVKMLESSLLSNVQSKQFLAELASIGRTNHHNIVRLVGFCWEGLHRLLVYEYVERGSLDHWIFVKGAAASAADGVPAPLLNWQTRYNVALGIARGLRYLHEECTQPILHFDIKPQNILLDNAFVAKLADFGMSRLMQRDVSEVLTGVRGTPGYIAPEWLSYGTVSKKSDVYSMGMVMLEIVGGRRNVDLALLNSAALDPEEWHFPSWAARKCEQGLMMELVDKRLQTFDEEQAQTLIHTAFWCIHENPGMRPYAHAVVQWLEGSSPVKQPPFSTAAHTQCPVERTQNDFLGYSQISK